MYFGGREREKERRREGEKERKREREKERKREREKERKREREKEREYMHVNRQSLAVTICRFRSLRV